MVRRGQARAVRVRKGDGERELRRLNELVPRLHARSFAVFIYIAKRAEKKNETKTIDKKKDRRCCHAAVSSSGLEEVRNIL